jgi:nitrite reductase/ring-hydroxylating ferredoxin subunit
MAMAWQAVANRLDLAEGEVKGLIVNGTPVALYCIDGEVLATHNTCTHAQACLSDGYLENGQIECPLHQALYDVRTGKAVSGPANGDLKVFPARVHDGQVQVDVDPVVA